MVFYKSIYLICIGLFFLGYTDSGNITEDQKLCKKNLRDDFDFSAGSLTTDIMSLPRIAFKNKVLKQFQTIHGLNYALKIIEKAATGLTESPKVFCERSKSLSPLCIKQLHEVYTITDENDTLSVIKWTYVYITEPDVPQTFKAIVDDEVVQYRHFAYAYFKHMVSHLDLYVSIPWPVAFCQNEEPNHKNKNQNYRQNTDVNPEESNRDEVTIKEIRRANARPRKKSKPNPLPTND